MRSLDRCLLIGTIPVLLLSTSGCSTGSAASCVGPTMSLSSTELRPGGEVQVTVENLIGECNDTNGGVNVPAQEMPVLLIPEGTESSIPLGTLGSDEGFHAEGTFEVPPTTPVGPARLTVGRDASIDVSVGAG